MSINKNRWFFGGIAAVAILAGAMVARVSGNSPLHQLPFGNAASATAASTARQQMARMIAETAARSAAQAAKSVVANGGVDTFNQTASIPAQMQPMIDRSRR